MKNDEINFTLADLLTYSKMQEYEAYIKSKADNTKYNYYQGILRYCNYTQMNPDELVKEADEDVTKGVIPRERSIKKHVLGFRNWLDDFEIECGNSNSKHLSINSKKIYFTGVKSFYKCFEHPFPELPSWEMSMPKIEHIEIAEKEHIRDALKICNTRNKAIIICGCCSGLAEDDLLNLTVEQFKKGYDPETEITTFKLRRGKTAYDFITFFTPEASRLVWQYLKERDMPTTLTDKWAKTYCKKQKVTPDSYLFVKNNISNKYLDTFDENLRKLSTDGLQKAYRVASEKAGLSTDKGVWNVFRGHNMRKYFKNALPPSDEVEFMMGHSLGAVKDAYYRGKVDVLKEKYKKEYVPLLTIQKELDLAESPEYLKVVADNDTLSKVHAETVIKLNEMESMKDELERLKVNQEFTSDIVNIITENPEFADILKKLKK